MLSMAFEISKFYLAMLGRRLFEEKRDISLEVIKVVGSSVALRGSNFMVVRFFSPFTSAARAISALL